MSSLNLNLFNVTGHAGGVQTVKLSALIMKSSRVNSCSMYSSSILNSVTKCEDFVALFLKKQIITRLRGADNSALDFLRLFALARLHNSYFHYKY